MLNNEESYKVAERLRGLDIHDWNDYDDEIDSLESAIECNVGQQFESQSWWHRLADLIDPTCKQVITECNDGLMPPFTAHCSKCGAQWGYTPNYCPNCRARVVD